MPENIKENINEENTAQDNDITPAERKKILQAINRTDTEKFLLFTKMMRIHFMLKNAKITLKD